MPSGWHEVPSVLLVSVRQLLATPWRLDIQLNTAVSQRFVQDLHGLYDDDRVVLKDIHHAATVHGSRLRLLTYNPVAATELAAAVVATLVRHQYCWSYAQVVLHNCTTVFDPRDMMRRAAARHEPLLAHELLAERDALRDRVTADIDRIQAIYQTLARQERR